MRVLVLKEHGKIVAVYRTSDDLFNDWPGKSWTPTGEAGWVDGHGLMAEATPWYERVVPVHERENAKRWSERSKKLAWFSDEKPSPQSHSVPGRMSFTVLEKG